MFWLPQNPARKNSVYQPNFSMRAWSPGVSVVLMRNNFRPVSMHGKASISTRRKLITGTRCISSRSRCSRERQIAIATIRGGTPAARQFDPKAQFRRFSVACEHLVIEGRHEPCPHLQDPVRGT